MKKTILILTILLLFKFTYSAYSKIIVDSAVSGWIDYGIYKQQKKIVAEYKYVKYSKDGKYIYTYSLDKLFRKWEAETGRLVKEFVIPYDSVTDVCIDVEGKRLCIATIDIDNRVAPVYIYDFINDSLFLTIQALRGFDGEIALATIMGNKIAINSITDELVTSVDYQYWIPRHEGETGLTNNWDIKTGEFISELPSDAPFCVKYSQDGNYLVLSSWHLYTNRDGGSGRVDVEYISKVLLFPKGNSIADTLYINDSRFNYLEFIFFCFTPDSKILAGSDNNRIRLWNTYDGSLIKDINYRTVGYGIISAIEFSRDGKYLIVGSNGSYNIGGFLRDRIFLRFLNFGTGQIIDSLFIEGYADITIDTSPDSSKIVCGLSNGRLLLFDFTSLLVVKDKPFVSDPNLIISPNPVLSSLKIDYNVPYYSFVKISICDIFGSEVKTIVDEYQSEGNKSIESDVNSLAEGIYFIKLQSGSEQKVDKFIKLK